MFSGKTSELIRRLDRARIANQKIQVFKSHHDIRYEKTGLVTHSGASFPANPVPESSSKVLRKMLDLTRAIIAIDEIQFFDEGIVTLCEDLANRGKKIILAGLDLDFRGEPFPGPFPSKSYPSPIAALMVKADVVDKLTAICSICGADATRSQRLVNGKYADWNELVLIVGANDVYEARCRLHHFINRPKSNEESQ
jgi:thymidine kinase